MLRVIKHGRDARVLVLIVVARPWVNVTLKRDARVLVLVMLRVIKHGRGGCESY